MGPAPYLLHVTSTPSQVSDETWKEWYVKEHIPDLFNGKACVRATFYEEVSLPSFPNGDQTGKFLALYQTDVRFIL